jgi:CBS domain-containing protein
MIASDIMTRKVVTISPEASVQKAAQLLDQFRISGIPVVDARGDLIGIITEADIISKVNRYGLLDQDGLRVADIMSRDVTTVDEDTPVGDIAMLLSERKIKRVPVVRQGRLVGIVSRGDIVHAVAMGHLVIRQW